VFLLRSYTSYTIAELQICVLADILYCFSSLLKRASPLSPTPSGGADLVATGDMGIGNTTASSAIVAAITGRSAAQVTGRGTGVDDSGLARKIAVIERALALHQPNPADGLGVLAKVGGFEIGGLAGVMIGAAAKRVPVVIVGFFSGAAALIACALAPAAQPYLIARHRSVERGHTAVFAQLELEPLLDLGMCLGEGTGAVLAQSLCRRPAKSLIRWRHLVRPGCRRKNEPLRASASTEACENSFDLVSIPPQLLRRYSKGVECAAQ
jgi:Phosphoribosyltransferase